MKNLSILILTLLLFISCKQSPEAKFNREGITFTCPEGWEITDEENFDNAGYYLSIEKDGLDSSGLLTITWMHNNLDLDEWLGIFQDELKNNLVYKNSDLAFDQRYESSYNGIPTRAVDFTASIIGVKHEGTIHAFYEKDKTFGILKQQATEDNNDNSVGFKAIENSFKLE